MDSCDTNVDYVQPVKLSDEQTNDLKEFLQRQLEQIESERASLMPRCEAWVKQANSRRSRMDAGPKDSNLDMPLTRERMMQNSSRLQNPIWQQETVFVARPRTPSAERTARSVERAMDYICDQVPIMAVTDAWIEQFQTFPFGVVKTPFITEYENIKEWKPVEFDAYNNAKVSGQKTIRRKLKNGTTKLFIENEVQDVVRKAAAIPEVVPFEDFLVPFNTPDPQHADIIFHRVWLSKPQIEDKVARGVYDKVSMDDLGEPSQERKKLLDMADPKLNRGQKSNAYEVFEAYLAYDVKGNGKKVEIIVTFERRSMMLLRCVYNWYHEYKRPFIHHCYKDVQGTMYGIPLTYILEPLHAAYSASFNQRLDAASLANEVALIVPPHSQLTKVLDKDGFRGAIFEANLRKEDIIEVKFAQPFTQLEGMEQRIEQRADRLSNLNPYSFGNEQSERPTATGVINLIEEGKTPQYIMLERFRESFALLGKHMLARYKQFFPEGLPIYLQQEDPEDAQALAQFFEWPEGSIESSVIIETRVSSSTMSKSVRKQELTSLLDRLKDVYQTMLGLAQVALDPMNPASAIASSALYGYNYLVNKALTEFEVAGKDVINPDMKGLLEFGQRTQQTIQQLQQQVQAAGNAANQAIQENQQLKGIIAQVQGAGLQGPPMGPEAGQAQFMG